MWNLIISYTVALNADRVGRRPLFMASEVGMVGAFAVVAALTAQFQMGRGSAYGVAAVPFLYVYYALYNLAWVPLPYSYASEILPFNLRAKGMALFVLAQNFGNCINQFGESFFDSPLLRIRLHIQPTRSHWIASPGDTTSFTLA